MALLELVYDTSVIETPRLSHISGQNEAMLIVLDTFFWDKNLSAFYYFHCTTAVTGVVTIDSRLVVQQLIVVVQQLI